MSITTYSWDMAKFANLKPGETTELLTIPAGATATLMARWPEIILAVNYDAGRIVFDAEGSKP